MAAARQIRHGNASHVVGALCCLAISMYTEGTTKAEPERPLLHVRYLVSLDRRLNRPFRYAPRR